MNSKLLTPIFSLVVRGSILAVLMIIALWIYFGALINIEADIFTYLASNTGLISSKLAELLKASVLVVLLLVLAVYSFKRDRLGIGLLKFMSLYSLSLLVLIAVIQAIVIIFQFSRGIGVFDASLSLIITIVLGLLVAIFSWKYPLVSIVLSIVDENGNESFIDPSRSIIVLDEDQILRVKIYGSRSIRVVAEPPKNFQVSHLVKGFTYNFVDVKPITNLGGKVKIYYNDTLIYNVGIKVKNFELKDVTFTVFFNDDIIYEQKYRVGLNETILDASKPAISAALARLGLTLDDVREIQFYTSENIHVPHDTLIRDIADVDKILVRIYSVEKHLELLKYYRKADVFKLWDTLIKRLEVLAESIREIEPLINSMVSELNTISGNWW